MSDHQHGSVKETIISIIISLAMALVAKAYVVEAFVIPTGSMAPTLLGKHMTFRSDATGYEWDVNPWFYGRAANGEAVPTRIQANPRSGGLQFPRVTDPMTTSQVNPPRRQPRSGYTLTGEPKQLRAGDRILVEKMLYEVTGPSRFDVVVFKNPQNPMQNFIKRLIGLNNEAIFLVDGDVFTADAADARAWDKYAIRTKPARVQRDVWRRVFSSEYTPPNPVDSVGRRFFETPWSGAGWTTADQRVFTTQDSGRTTLTWDTEAWPINDWNPYNEVQVGAGFQGGRSFLDPEHYFPVSDLRLRAGVEPESDGLTLVATIEARGCVYQALLDGTNATLRMTDGSSQWRVLATTPHGSPKPGRVTEVEFWHWDQRLALFIDGKEVLSAGYDWDPSERLERVVGSRAEDIAPRDIVLEKQSSYAAGRPSVTWSFEGSALSLHRVGLDKDIYYRPDGTQRAANPHEVAVLNDAQYFVLGDNSAASADGRKWDAVDPEVAKVDPTVGVVPARLLLGKAFFVYFPAPHNFELFGLSIPVPDFGHMRAIN